MVDTKNSVQQYMKRGVSLLLENKYKEAEETYRQAIKLQPDHPWSNCNLGRSLLSQGKIVEAIPYLQKAIELDSNIAEAYYNLGNAFTKQNRFDEAVNAYRTAIELEPDRFLYHHQLGDSLLLQGKCEAAVSPYRKAIELNSHYAWSYHNLGKVLSELGKWEEAIAVFQKAIKITSDLPDVHEKLGEALMQDRLQKEANLPHSNSIEEDESLLQLEQDLIKRHPLPHKIYLPTGKIPLQKRVEGLERVVNIYENTWKSIYQPKLLELKEKYKNHDRAFIIGNGPSINSTDLELLKDEVTFGVNGIFLKSQETGFIPTFYVVEDHLVAEDRQEAINRFKGPTKLFPISLAYCVSEGEDTLFFDHRPRISYPDAFDFSTDASTCTYTGCTVTFACMQLSYFLGFKNIYLIGVDCSYSIPEDAKVDQEYDTETLDMDSDDVNHFHPDYFGKGYRWHDPQVHKMKEAYQEARRVCNETNVNMYNATLGGKLEVFPRVDYYSLFETNQIYPRLLIIDMTRLGSISATGQVKKNLFAQWLKANILQIYSCGKTELGLYSEAELILDQEKPLSHQRILTECKRFNPQLIYYRPVADKPELHNFACQLIDELAVPVVTHVMDDWPERLSHENPTLFTEFDRSFRALLEQSAARFSICQSMSTAFEERYGVDFAPFANCVEPEDWTSQAVSNHSNESFVIRYIGGLADDMNFTSISEIAAAVAELHPELPVQLEIYTSSHWKPKAVSAFSDLPNVSINEANFSQAEYRQLLCTANALIIAYNFNETSLRYVRYSMANKLPECLAAGVPLLVYGSPSVATVDYAVQTQTVQGVTERNPELLKSAIRELVENPKLCQKLGQRGRKYAFEHHNAQTIRYQLYNIMRHAVTEGKLVKNLPILTTGINLMGVFPKNQHAYIDETNLILEGFSQNINNAILIANSSSKNIDENRLNQIGCQALSFDINQLSQMEKALNENSTNPVDFLKIDAIERGNKILQEWLWHQSKPTIIQCRFDQGESGSNFEPMTQTLTEKGYTVLVSEWHPSTASQVRKDWCRLLRFPCELLNSKSWGYLIAFQQEPDFVKLRQLAQQLVRVQQSNQAGAKFYLESAKALVKEGKIEEAIAELKLAIEAEPEKHDSSFQIAELLLKHKRFEEAASYYQNVVEIKPDHYWSWRGLGDALSAQKQLEEAINCYRKVTELSPNYFFGWQRLGNTLEKIGNQEMAVTVYKKALEIKPESTEIRKALSKYQEI